MSGFGPSSRPAYDGEVKFFDCYWNKHQIASRGDAQNGVMNPDNMIYAVPYTAGERQGPFNGGLNCPPDHGWSDAVTYMDENTSFGQPTTLPISYVVNDQKRWPDYGIRDSSTVVQTSLVVQGSVELDAHNYTHTGATWTDVDHCAVWIGLVLDKEPVYTVAKSQDMFINPNSAACGMIPEPFRNPYFLDRYEVLDSQFIEPMISHLHEKEVVGSDNTQGAIYSNLHYAVDLRVDYEMSVKMGDMKWKAEAVGDEGDEDWTLSLPRNGVGALGCEENCIHLVAFAGQELLKSYFYGHSRMEYYDL